MRQEPTRKVGLVRLIMSRREVEMVIRNGGYWIVGGYQAADSCPEVWKVGGINCPNVGELEIVHLLRCCLRLGCVSPRSCILAEPDASS